MSRCRGTPRGTSADPRTCIFTPARSHRPDRLPGGAAEGNAAVLAGPGQQPAGARWRHPRRGHRHQPRPRHGWSSVNDTTLYLRRRRALRAPRAPVHQVGHGPRGVPRRHSRRARWRAGDERRCVRWRDLAARAQRGRVRCARQRAPPRCARILVRLSPHRSRPCQANIFLVRCSISSIAPALTEDGMRELIAKRKETQPIGEWSCGSTFTNPTGEHAARLIEAAGLKGIRIGDIMVSTQTRELPGQRGRGHGRRRREPGGAHPGHEVRDAVRRAA